MIQLSHQYKTTGKTTALTIQTFVYKVVNNKIKSLHFHSFNYTDLCLQTG